ncbi:MAG TPA: SDR family NAD(P)-dependent oxidoreductase [Burkholderiales bacterium]|nr:SDR family NAD(P)-dependent oxidoreductase [Burkholderiales bacterium]
MAATGRLAGAVAIITAAGQGIGESIAKIFAREGAALGLVDIDANAVKALERDLAAAGARAFALCTDVTRSSAVQAMVREVIERYSTIDILVNAAGGFHQLAPITGITDEEWDRVINLNLRSVFYCSRAVAPILMEKKQGRIVNIASGAGITFNPYAPSYLPYGAAKAGVINFTKLLARELGPYGITVNAISPGTTRTPRVVAVRDAASLERIAAQNPMKCLVEPADTAEAALFLASAEARYITGVNLNVNAGNLM